MYKQICFFFSLICVSRIFRVTFDDTCLVYLIYADDNCRGEPEKEKKTKDKAVDHSVRHSNKQVQISSQINSQIVPNHYYLNKLFTCCLSESLSNGI